MERKQTLSIEIPNPVYPSLAALGAVREKISELLSTAYSSFQDGASQVRTRGSVLSKIRLPRIKRPSFNFNKKNLLKLGVPVIGVLVLVFVLGQALSAKPSIQGVSETVTDKPLSTQQLNKEFTFPLRDEDGKEAGSFRYIIESAELRKQIIVKGQRATAVDGRIFLILNLKLINDLDKGININTRDFVRVYVNGKSEELFAPDIHNDPVEAQAISTKNTRLGLAINESDHDITLKIGEIDGEKQEIKLNF